VDLVAMPGLDHAMAMRIAAAAPFASVEEVGTVEGVDAAIVGTLEEMEAAMARLQASAEDEEELTLSIMGLLMPSIRRAVAALLLSAVLGGLVYATVRRRGGACAVRWLRVAINGIAVGIVACTTAWLAGPAAALGVVGLLLGLPGAALELRSSRQPALAGVVLLAWLASSLVAIFIATPW